MLVVISDLHITDGTTATNVAGAAFTEVLLSEIKSKVANKEISEVNLVLLGDIFDLVRTDYWINKDFSNDNKPWYGELDENLMNSKKDTHGGFETEIEYHYNKVLEKILNHACTQGFKSMVKQVSEIYKDGQKINFKISYIIGNHDRALNNYDSLKNQIENFFQGVLIEFINILSEETKYKTIARHGHEHDKNNHAFEYCKKFIKSVKSKYDPRVYKIQTIGEAITAELMSGVVYDAKEKIKNDPDLIRKVYEINNVRPMETALDWLAQLSTEKNISVKTQKILVDSFNSRLSSLLDSSLAKKWDEITIDTLFFGQDIIDKLQLVKVLTSGQSLNGLRSKVKLVQAVRSIIPGSNEDEFEEGAKEDFKNHKNCQYILYGHTHVEKQVNFTSTIENSLNLYINTGTYLPLVQQSKSDNTFYTLNQLSMIFIYMNEEDIEGKDGSFPTIDIWVGKKHKNYKRI